MKQVPELELAAAAAMIQAHESAKVVDHDAVMELQARIEVKNRNLFALSSAVPFLSECELSFFGGHCYIAYSLCYRWGSCACFSLCVIFGPPRLKLTCGLSL